MRYQKKTVKPCCYRTLTQRSSISPAHQLSLKARRTGQNSKHITGMSPHLLHSAQRQYKYTFAAFAQSKYLQCTEASNNYTDAVKEPRSPSRANAAAPNENMLNSHSHAARGHCNTHALKIDAPNNIATTTRHSTLRPSIPWASTSAYRSPHHGCRRIPNDWKGCNNADTGSARIDSTRVLTRAAPEQRSDAQLASWYSDILMVRCWKLASGGLKKGSSEGEQKDGYLHDVLQIPIEHSTHV